MFLDEQEIAVGIAPPPAMVNVRDRQDPAGFGDELRRAVEERRGVGAAGDREEDRYAGRQKADCRGSGQCGGDQVHS